MPLSMAELGKDYIVKAVTGNDKTRRHLQNLGFTQGAVVVVISSFNGNFIVNVRETRIAVSGCMANKILITM